jgi:hypothetical protein
MTHPAQLIGKRCVKLHLLFALLAFFAQLALCSPQLAQQVLRVVPMAPHPMLAACLAPQGFTPCLALHLAALAHLERLETPLA